MNTTNWSTRRVVAARSLWTAFGLVLAMGCGSRMYSQTGGETGFWESCVEDAECKTGLCACGVCTTTCDSRDECGRSSASCGTALDGTACTTNTVKVCLPPPSSTSPEVSGSTTDVDCRGPGHYETGKEGGYLPCCDGLEEIFQLKAAYGEQNEPVCVEAPLRVYACVQGSCGDGVCEVGEDVPCGCADDCPEAAWGATPAPAPTGSEGDASGEPLPPCMGFACETSWLQASAGTVEIQVDFEGPFCSNTCGVSRPTVVHVESGLYVPMGRATSCSVCREFSSTAECEGPTVAGYDWDGSVSRFDATCTSDRGSQLACQNETLFAPPGRYRAEICSLPAPVTPGEDCSFRDGEEERCESVEFDYPTSEPVVIRFDNTPSDAGG